MSIEKVKRYDLKLAHCDLIREDRAGRYIEYADVAGLVDALKAAADWMETVEAELYRMEGGDCFDGAPTKQARNELARWTP